MKTVLETTGLLIGALGAFLTAITLIKPTKREKLMRKLKKYLKSLAAAINYCFLSIYQLIPGSKTVLEAEVLDSKKYYLPSNYTAVKVTAKNIIAVPFNRITCNVPFFIGYIRDRLDYSWYCQYGQPVEKVGEEIVWNGEAALKGSFFFTSKNRSCLLIFDEEKIRDGVTVTLSGNKPLKSFSQHFNNLHKN